MGDIAEPQKLKCKIINTEPDPKHPGRQIVSIQIDDGDKLGPYIRAVSILPRESPISIEKLSIDLAAQDLSRPVDPYHYIKEAKELKTEFTIIPEDEPNNPE